MLLYSTIIDASVEGFAFTGFDWRRRSLSASTFARGEGNTANKQLILTRVASLDSGKDHLQQWRDDTTGYISDQGAGERGVHCAPHGDRAEVREVLRLVRQGALALNSGRARKIQFLYNALEQTGNWHLMFNPVEHAIKSLPEWPLFQQGLKAFCKAFGEPGYKEKLLKTWFAGADKSVRHRVHRFNKEFVDFQWQHVFEVVDQVVDLIVPTREVANASCFDKDDTVIIRVVAFVRLEFNEFFAEVLLLFTSSVGTTLPLHTPPTLSDRVTIRRYNAVQNSQGLHVINVSAYM